MPRGAPPLAERNSWAQALFFTRMRPRMRHLAPIALPLALTAATPAAAGTLATAKVVQCSTGQSPAKRLAVFRGAARPAAATDRMWIKFTLQESSGGSRFRAVAAPGLGVWRKSRSGVQRFAIRQRVLALAHGASYRVAVRYRWYTADGELIHRARRISRACTQPGALPNLRVTRIGGRVVNGTFRYAIDVVNRGRASSGPTTVRLSVDGDVVDAPAVPALAPGKARRVSVNGPSCTGAVSAMVDPAHLVREGNEGDNVFNTGCPS